MTDKAREALELRAIVVSTRAALGTSPDATDAEGIRTTSTELLARLLERVIRDGADPAVIADVRAARAALWP
ncbi:MAG: hypothetical protein ABI622_08800 [Chloroflexota bacterium]